VPVLKKKKRTERLKLGADRLRRQYENKRGLLKLRSMSKRILYPTSEMLTVGEVTQARSSPSKAAPVSTSIQP
jgi:hypothetical protein